ncbi:MAG: nitroreductase family protein, partial [Deltaproteobacteria bacterium]|nr:nitroreductase family protein [Deltaproteobacteria bacterium]
AERLHEEHGLDVTVETFLDHPSIAALAAGICGPLPETAGAYLTGQLPVQAACLPDRASPPAASCAVTASDAAVQDMLRKIQIVLPVDAFTDRAMLDQVTARVRQLFAESRITVGAGTPPPPAPPHALSASLPQAQVAAPTVPSAQQYLAAAFTSVLRISSIAPDADFFDLGVTSLNLIEIAELLHEQHGIDVPVEVFLDHTTLSSLAQYLQGKLPAASPRSGDAVPPAQEHCSPRPVSASSGAADSALEPVSFAPQEYASCACRRSFAADPVPLRSLSRLLGLLKEETVSGQPKYLYPSAGGLNAVQTYVYVKAGRVEAVPAGMYYYHPATHQLMAVGEGVLPQESMHPANRPVFEKAGFCIFFIAQLAALRPVYDCLSPALALLDAGYMQQLLMSRQEAAGLGLCPLAGTDFSSVRDLFSLEETHLFMACLAGGLPDSRADISGSPADVFQGKLTDHFAGPAPDWACLRLVAVGALDCLNVLTPEQHEELHRSQPHLRKMTRPQTQSLQPVSFLHNQYVLRSTQRSFARRPAAFAAFSKFMALLRLVQQSGGYAALYDSAAGAYAVQVYLHIQEGAVEQVPAGIYLYDQVGHKLRRISRAGAAELRQAHFPRNRSYFAEAGFSIFCIADLSRLEPLFGSQGHQLAMLEAGCIGQVLMDHQAEFGMGVCPIGAMRFEGLRGLFGLGQQQVLLHSFLCGPVDRSIPRAGINCLKRASQEQME